jgi:hypothetical protein
MAHLRRRRTQSNGFRGPKEWLADAILFGALKGGGTAKVERKGEGLGIVTKAL